MKTAHRVALVSGSSRGIGRAIALQLAQDGCAVVVNYVQQADAAQLVVQQIEQEGDRQSPCRQMWRKRRTAND